MKWALFGLSVACGFSTLFGGTPYLVALGVTALVVLMFEVYFKNQENMKLKEAHAKIEEAFGILQKNQLTSATHLKRLEDKIEAVAQGLPVTTRMRPK